MPATLAGGTGRWHVPCPTTQEEPMMRCHLLLAVAVLAGGLGMTGTPPASALSVSLTVVDPVTGQGRLAQLTGQFLNLIATTDQDVSPPYNILIYDAFGTPLVGYCDRGRSCTVPVRRDAPT